jgi:hypothetical protein
MLNVEFSESGVRFFAYSYPPASVFPSGEIAWSRVAEVDPSATPPEIRVGGEILFVAATTKRLLGEWCAHYAIPVVQRVDIWGLLLEPFLDTEFTSADEERTRRMLGANGVSDEEAVRIRHEVGECMERYNIASGLWDWCHLGLSDVLDARMGRLAGDACRLAEEDFKVFYWAAMELALRGNPKP